MTFVLGDHLNEPDCDVLSCDEIEGTYFHLDGGLVSFVEHDDSNHVTVLVRDPRDGTIIDDDSGIDLGNGKFKFSAAGNAWLENGILHFEKPGSMSESGMKIHGCSCSPEQGSIRVRSSLIVSAQFYGLDLTVSICTS